MLAALFTLDVWAALNSPLVIAVLSLVVGLVLAWHPMKALAAKLRADAEHRQGLLKLLEGGGASLADQLDAFLTSNGQDVKDLLDPAKRAAAEAHLAEQGKAAVAQALKESLPRG